MSYGFLYNNKSKTHIYSLLYTGYGIYIDSQYVSVKIQNSDPIYISYSIDNSDNH